MVGAAADFPIGRVGLVEVGGREIGVVRIRSGFRAYLNLCPHRHAPVCRGQVTGTMLPSEPGTLLYSLEGMVLKCPWHGWEFDLDSGRALFGISNKRLRSYAVEEADGYLWLTVGAATD
jgi:nitrite reductase/ring-hydroxylating ferredoxin subunit